MSDKNTRGPLPDPGEDDEGPLTPFGMDLATLLAAAGEAGMHMNFSVNVFPSDKPDVAPALEELPPLPELREEFDSLLRSIREGTEQILEMQRRRARGEKVVEGVLEDREPSEIDRVFAELQRIDLLQYILGAPMPFGDMDGQMEDIGRRRAHEIARGECERLGVARFYLTHHLRRLQAEQGGAMKAGEPAGASDAAAAEPADLSAGAAETLWCLFAHGPTFDGDLPSKSGRDELIDRGWAENNGYGYQWLTFAGVAAAIERGFHRRKETKRQR